MFFSQAHNRSRLPEAAVEVLVKNLVSVLVGFPQSLLNSVTLDTLESVRAAYAL